MDYSTGKMRNRTQTTDNFPRMVLGLEQNEVSIKIKYLALIIGKLNFLRVQVREASLYLQRMDSAKTKPLKKKYWKKSMTLPLEILQELYWWQVTISKNMEMILEVRTPQAIIVSDASSKGWGATLELETGDTLVQLGEWKEELTKQTSNKKEMEAIFLGLYRYGGILKDLHIKAILIKSDRSTAVQDLAKWRSGESLVAKVKKIDGLCQQLKIQTQTQYIPGILNKITNALNRLNTVGDYSVKKVIFQALCQAWRIVPTLNLFVFCPVNNHPEGLRQSLLFSFSCLTHAQCGFLYYYDLLYRVCDHSHGRDHDCDYDGDGGYPHLGPFSLYLGIILYLILSRRQFWRVYWGKETLVCYVGGLFVPEWLGTSCIIVPLGLQIGSGRQIGRLNDPLRPGQDALADLIVVSYARFQLMLGCI
ncbi:MAG: hypothetical protein EZS28_035610 [Streblomastix strix]|uniref:RNase H type-1 domain-containing protein n=1 Tax=Streblomastix strix TaxID=222440 RepID=A0A5J4UF58_9EUKA|nr:MAG: hypothetical protein EZS28_035610 [Streblomastix strix]